MTEKKRTLLQIPQGTEGFYLEEAFMHRQITHHLDRLFYSWGYLPAQTPVFDFYDTYSPLLDKKSIDKIYRLIDREGDLLMLRSDITLFLAKQMGTALNKTDLPVRVCYSDSILRHQNREDLSKNEFFQTGAELIGKAGIEGDLEILMLLIRSLETLDVPGVIHIGSQGMFRACFGNFDDKDRKNIAYAISDRNHDTLLSLCRKGLPEDLAKSCADLFGFIGTGSEFSLFLKEQNALLPEMENEAKYLVNLYNQLEELAPGQEVRIDLSEIATQPYHTGIVFQTYLPGVDAAVANGGRYDKLMSAFGFDSPSVGFSLMLRKIEQYLADSNRFTIKQESIQVEGNSFIDAFRKAEKIRETGGTATL